MNFEQAVEQLSFHCGSNPNIDDPRGERGWLQTLRPYKGALDQDAWSSVLQCVDAVAEHLQQSRSLDRSVINSLWGICFFSRYWALNPDGMLPRNDLISSEDQATMAKWLEDLEFRITMMLDGGSDPKRL